MSDLTVGQVAGIINGAVIVGRSTLFRRMMASHDKLSVAQVTLPLAVVCVLAGILKDSNNAVTWYDAFVFHICLKGLCLKDCHEQINSYQSLQHKTSTEIEQVGGRRDSECFFLANDTEDRYCCDNTGR